MKKENTHLKKFTLDTKKPFGDPNALRIGAFGTLIIIILIDGQLGLNRIVNYKNVHGFLYPFLLLIIPLSYPTLSWVKLHIINRKDYNKLMQVVHSERLIDYSENKQARDPFNQRKVIAGVKIVYEETYAGIYLTFYPRGIRNSNGARTLNRRLEELFGLSVIGVNNQLTHTTYLLSNVQKQNYEVIDSDF